MVIYTRTDCIASHVTTLPQSRDTICILPDGKEEVVIYEKKAKLKQIAESGPSLHC